jgi:hypothetical protein
MLSTSWNSRGRYLGARQGKEISISLVDYQSDAVLFPHHEST